VTKRSTLEVMAGALRVHPSELTGQPWSPQDPASANRRQVEFWAKVGRALVAEEGDPGHGRACAAARRATGPAADPP
jgi:hypothetical protein